MMTIVRSEDAQHIPISAYHTLNILLFLPSYHNTVRLYLQSRFSSTNGGFTTDAAIRMRSRGFRAVAGRLHHPPTLSRCFRYLTIHPAAVNDSFTIGIRRRWIGYGDTFTSFPSIPMATHMPYSTKATNGEKPCTVDPAHDHERSPSHNHNHTTTPSPAPDHDHGHENHDHNDHSHSHSHSHGIFSAFGHTHSREDSSTAGAEKIVEALKGGSEH
jgi:hypothetical protein